MYFTELCTSILYCLLLRTEGGWKLVSVVRSADTTLGKENGVRKCNTVYLYPIKKFDICLEFI